MSNRSAVLDDPTLRELVAGMSLEEKVRLLTGGDFWSTHQMERIGLEPIVFSDGPSGVRGEVWDERQPSVNLPSSTALAATWDVTMAAAYGEVLAAEARRKNVDVVLGPTINMQRTPGDGRHFECFSEDPVLTSELAAAYVKAIQAHGVGATPKHYLCNDFETDRYTVDVVVDERTLREVYLLAFEKAVTEAGAWAVMSAYNSINGATASENDLLETPLNSEWGFDGVVVGDWTGVRTVNSARYSQDLAMPGPDGPWGGALVAAVREGVVDEAAVDRKVLRLLGLAARLGRLKDHEPEVPPSTPTVHPEWFARKAASAGAVLLENRLLPLDPDKVRKVAIIGYSARAPRTQGGGSASVVPDHIITPLEGVRRAFPDAEVSYAAGPLVENGLTPLPIDRLMNPTTGTPGVRVRFTDELGVDLHVEDRRSTDLVWLGGEAPIEQAAALEVTTIYVPDETGTLELGVGTVGTVRIWVDEVLVFDQRIDPVGTDLGAALLAAPVRSVGVPVEAGTGISLRLSHTPPAAKTGLQTALGFRFGVLPPAVDDDRLIEEAVALAASADLVVVLVGSNKELEAEGHDRETLRLPGRQDELVEAVAAVNARTVVIANCGAPMVLPWAAEVGAVLQMWFGGQEMGTAIGDILTGRAEPGGRLPTTWPRNEDDVPIFQIRPVDGKVVYDEGIHVGYRNWLRLGRTPAYPFGHGLGYTTWKLKLLSTPSAVAADLGGPIPVRAHLTNTGTRPGKQVLQVYARREDSTVERPELWLVGFAVAHAGPGETVEVEVRFTGRAFAHWDNGWQLEAGEFELRVGFSSNDVVATAKIRVADGNA